MDSKDRKQDVYSSDYVQLLMRLTQLDSGFKTMSDKMSGLENRIISLMSKLEERVERSEAAYFKVEQAKELDRRISSLEADRAKAFWALAGLFATNIISIISFIATRVI